MWSALQEPINRTVHDYNRLADLEFALIVWRQNLRRDLACTASKTVSAACTLHVAAVLLLLHAFSVELPPLIKTFSSETW